MSQSAKWVKIHQILSDSKQIKQFLEVTRNILSKHNDFSLQSFRNSQDSQYLLKMMELLDISGLKQVLSQIYSPAYVVALPISMQKMFTLHFVIVPQGMKFDWHNHPKMTGFSKCAYGVLDITSIDIHKLEKQDVYFTHPLNKMRFERLIASTHKQISVIEPQSYNIHKIESNLGLSAFFDLLMPDYPQNLCDFFTTVQINNDTVVLKKLQNSQQVIKGFDEAMEDSKYKSEIVQTVILK